LTDLDGAVLFNEELDDLSRLWCVDRDVDLVVPAVQNGSRSRSTSFSVFVEFSFYFSPFICKENPVLTLSVSMVAISSSCLTKSPTCFDHCFKVPSVIDSAWEERRRKNRLAWLGFLSQVSERET
jgi:hypothetical protein